MSDEQQSDEQLARAWQAGSQTAFVQLFNRYDAMLLRFLRSLGGTLEKAEDAAQTAWLKAIANRAQLRGHTFRPWLFRIAHRVWIDECRSAWESRRVSIDHGGDDGGVQDTAPPPDARLTDPAPSALETLLVAEERAIAWRAIADLPTALRETLLLRLDAGLTTREIAEATNAPQGTVLWRLHEATRRLQEKVRVHP